MFLLVSGKISEITWQFLCVFFLLKNFKPKKDVPTTCPKHKSQASQEERFEHEGSDEMKRVRTKRKKQEEDAMLDREELGGPHIGGKNSLLPLPLWPRRQRTAIACA